MDCPVVKVEVAEELEPLFIREEGDVAESGVVSSGANYRGSAPDGQTGEGETEENMMSGMCLPNQQTTTGEERRGERVGDEEDRVEMSEDVNDGQNRDDTERDAQTQMRIKETREETREVTPADREDLSGLTSSDQPPEGTQHHVKKQARRLTPDFPDALYELLCTMQEGRRLNDQRCSFRLEDGFTRRRCHSEPSAGKPAHRVIFSSMTSLQKEEFFELVATSQARRLDDQRAELQRSPPRKPRTLKSFRGSLKQLSIVRKPTPLPVPKEELYNMILTTQAQGRLEEQRSRAPGPMDDEDFFSLLLRVQGGRMEEQRTELPPVLQT